MRMDLSHTRQRSSSTLDSDIMKPSPVSLGSMRPTNSCLEMIGSRNTICQLIGFPRRWNSDGVQRNPVSWSRLSHMSLHPPLIGRSHFWKYSDNNTSTSSHLGGPESIWTSN